MAWWRWRVSAVSRSAVCSLTSLRVFAWLQSAAGRGPARRTESWYSNISPCLFSLFTPGCTTAIYLLSDCSDLQGDSHDKKLWGCEPRLFDFDRKILSQEELWRERRSERSENVNIFPDNFEICERNDLQDWTRRYTTRHYWAGLSLSNVSDWWKNSTF